MNFQHLFDFLRDLNSEGHNDKSWMDLHRKEYHSVRDGYIKFLDDTNHVLKKIDPDYLHTTGKEAINRINNNKVFKPNAPTYKDHFGASLDKGPERSDFYIHLGINGSFIAAGFYHAPNDMLKLIRQEIDYNGEEFDAILEEKEFKKMTGELWMDDSLRTTPKGYDKEHPRIHFLKLKSFVAQRDLSEVEITQNDFMELLADTYKVMLPFRRYLDRALDG